MPKPMTSWSSYLGATENWLLDSGATNHLMLFGSNFTEYMAYSESHKTILLGDGVEVVTPCHMISLFWYDIILF